MKKIVFLAVALLLLIVGESFSQSCFPNCTNPPYQTLRADFDIDGTDCSIIVEYKYRTIICNGVPYFELHINWVGGVLSSECPELTFGAALINKAIELILSTPGVNPFDMPDDPGDCITNYLATGPACWESVWRPLGPAGAGYYLYPCATEPSCCKIYKVCMKPDGTFEPTGQPYQPAQCNVIGPQTHLPCFNWCP